MHLFNLFKAFSANPPSQSAGEAEIAVPSSDPLKGSSRKRRRLKRRTTKHLATAIQPEEAASLSSIRIPDRNEGFRSAPNLLGESPHPVQNIQSRSWSPIPTLPRQTTAMASSRLREDFSERRSWTSYERPTESPRYAEPLDEQLSSLESPIFGPREQGLFRNEMPYEMDSPLSQLASGWRDTPRYIPRKLPDPPIPLQEPFSGGEMAYDMPTPHPKASSSN
ncbi:hypothetical protein B0H19DRAFT_1269597 [Mycena capillaripes]|nr:hypothetical protein B0H19DRAFT_1269597 [Mycena capillaripes]